MGVRVFDSVCYSLLCWLCFLSLSPVSRAQHAASTFHTSQLLGEWYDVGRTTHIWGTNTWTSQQWNFVLGEDGTVVALFNGMCKACGGCSDAVVFKVTESSATEDAFLLQGNGETLSFTVEADLGTNIVVSICFTANSTYRLDDCPKPQLQVSVLSRQAVMKDLDQWLHIIRHLPVGLDKLDSSSGENCPRLFIDPKLVTANLVNDTDVKVLNMVGFDSRRSSLVLPCSLGQHAGSLQEGSKVIWSKERMGVVLTKNSSVLKRAEGVRLLHSTADRFDLLLRGVNNRDVDVYTCRLHNGKDRVLLTKVAVSSGGFQSGPVIVYHSSKVMTKRGETAVLECFVNGNPPPQVKWWMRTPGQQEVYVLKGKGGNKMRIRNVQVNDEGLYKCEASSKIASTASATINLQVGFSPESTVKNDTVSAELGGQVTLTCQVFIKSPDTVVWQRNSATLIAGRHRTVSLVKISDYSYQLTLLIEGLLKEDFGLYACLAQDSHGASYSIVEVKEQPYTGERCQVNNIPVMKDFDVQKFLGDMELLQTTRSLWGDLTPESEVQGFFITLSGSLVRYFRGFRFPDRQCLQPGTSSLVKLDTPGDYLVSFGNHRGRLKIVYTDYTHTVTYFCASADDQKMCPQHLVQVQILSREPHVPEKVLRVLYRHVQQTCVHTTGLVDTVPGICHIPADFMNSRGWIGRYPALNCQVANLQAKGNITADQLIGIWHLVGEVRPMDYTSRQRNSVYIVWTADRVILLHRAIQSGLCSATEADVLQNSLTSGSYYYDYKGRTVDSKILFVDEASLVLYTCLAVQHDGTCYFGSQLVELYQRSVEVEGRALLWMTRATAQACVDIGKLHRLQPSATCPVPENVVMAANTGLVNGSHLQIGCHQSLIPVPEGFAEHKLEGEWTVMYRNVESLASRGSVHHFSQSYHIVRASPGRLLLLVRHFESDWNLCPPTRVMRLMEKTGPGDYTHVSHSTTVAFKVLSLSEDTAVVYWCHGVSADGVCRPHRLTVEMLARSSNTVISEQRLRSMQQSSINVCVDLHSLQPTAQMEKCNITREVLEQVQQGNVTAAFDVPILTCNDQLLKGASHIDVERLTGEWTVVWRNEYFWGTRAPYAESAFIIVTKYGLLYLWRSYNNDLDRCGPEEAGRFMSTSGPGDYYSGFGGVPVAMKILKTDYSTMLAMWCHLDEHSRCHPHRTTIEILSRNGTVDNATRDTLMEMVDLSCLDNGNWVPSDPDICRVENDVLTTAYIDGLDKVEYSKIGCRVDLIGSHANVTVDMVLGSWRSVYQSRMTDSERPAASIHFYFSSSASGHISLLYRLYSADKEECLPASVMDLSRDRTSSGATFQLKYCNSQAPYGFAYMLDGDGEQLVMLLCKGVTRDGMCETSGQNLVLLHRDGWTPDINDTMQQTVTSLAADACVDPQSLVVPTLEPCPVPQAILTDASSGKLQACSDGGERVQCYPGYIPLHPAFDVGKFAGTWYTVSSSEAKDNEEVGVIKSTTYHFVPRHDGSVAMLFVSGSEESCQPAQLQALRMVEPGHFVFDVADNTQVQGMMKVAWMDDDLAAVYWCFPTATSYDINAPCPDSRVSVLSRRRETGGKGESLPPALGLVVADLCVSPHSYQPVDAESCKLPADIVSALDSDDVEIQANYSVIQCAQQFVPTVDDFDMSMFSGVWHTVRQTRLMWGDNTWDSLIRSFVVRDDGTAVMAFTGYPPGDGHCFPMDIRTLQVTNDTAQLSYGEAGEEVTMKVVWTDYNGSALLYTCSGETGPDGLCPLSSLQLEFLSRTPNISALAEERLVGLLPSLCVMEEDVMDVMTDMCQITKELQHLVGSSKDGATQSAVSCRVKDIPLDKNFTLPQMTGTWYEIARTRFTFNTMESVISVFEYEPDKDYLTGLFIGTLHKQCQSPLKSLTRKKMAEGPDSIIEGRIQVGDSIFPWITFNILYYDSEVLMHLACYLENEDGTCPRDKTEVTLLGRTRQLAQSMEEKLDGLMKSVCLSKDDLVPTKETADCMPMLMKPEQEATAGLPDTSGCPLAAIPVVENFIEDDVQGIWYGVGGIDFGADSNTTGYVVFISRSTQHSLQWRRWNVRNGSCQAEKAVYMKAACTGSKTGDYISTRASSFMLQWTTVKILQLQNNLMLVYMCTREAHEGSCHPDGIHVDLLSRGPTVQQDDIAPLLNALPSVCLKPEDMKVFPLTTKCDKLASEIVPEINSSACAVDQLPAVHVDIEKISGVWYEVAHIVDKMFPMQKAVIVYQTLPDDQIAMYFTALSPMGECQVPMVGRMRQRCPSQAGPETMGRLKYPGIWSWAPWRILHINYNSSMIGLSCVDEKRDGSCSAQGLKLHFLSRDPNPDPDLRPALYAKLKALACFDGVPMEDVYHKGPSCKHKLDFLLAPAA